MNEEASQNDIEIKDNQPVQEYSRVRQIVNNVPYAIMAVLGSTVFIAGFESPALGWITGVAYFLYCVAGSLWIMIFVCPYCERYDTMCCPCGYSRIAAKLRPLNDTGRFKEQFRKHIPVIVPLWFIPVVAGVVFAILSFSWLMVILLIVFALDAFVVLPLFSTRHGCADCPQRESCPWMGPKE